MIKTGNTQALTMIQADFDKVVRALSLKTRREILKTITDYPKTLAEVYEELRKKGVPIRHRESAYKALERLVSIGLVEKIFEKRTVRYKSRFSKIMAHLIHEKLELL